MKVLVKLFATLRNGRGRAITIPNVINGYDIIEKLNIPQEEVAIFLINGLDAKLDTPINDGDFVSIFPPVGGG